MPDTPRLSKIVSLARSARQMSLGHISAMSDQELRSEMDRAELGSAYRLALRYEASRRPSTEGLVRAYRRTEHGRLEEVASHRRTAGRGLLKMFTGADVVPHGMEPPSGLESAIAARRAAHRHS
jgi:hypothetical protein